MSEKVQPAHIDEFVYKAYARCVESEVVLVLVASCSYLVDADEMQLDGEAGLAREDETQTPQKYYYHSITYDVADAPTQPSPATLTVRDGAGTHDVAVEAWQEQP